MEPDRSDGKVGAVFSCFGIEQNILKAELLTVHIERRKDMYEITKSTPLKMYHFDSEKGDWDEIGPITKAEIRNYLAGKRLPLEWKRCGVAFLDRYNYTGKDVGLRELDRIRLSFVGRIRFEELAEEDSYFLRDIKIVDDLGRIVDPRILDLDGEVEEAEKKHLPVFRVDPIPYTGKIRWGSGPESWKKVKHCRKQWEKNLPKHCSKMGKPIDPFFDLEEEEFLA